MHRLFSRTYSLVRGTWTPCRRSPHRSYYRTSEKTPWRPKRRFTSSATSYGCWLDRSLTTCTHCRADWYVSHTQLSLQALFQSHTHTDVLISAVLFAGLVGSRCGQANISTTPGTETLSPLKCSPHTMFRLESTRLWFSFWCNKSMLFTKSRFIHWGGVSTERAGTSSE